MADTSRRGWHISRDLVLFIVGLAIIIQQTLGTSFDRPYLLALAGWMVGLPVFLSTDLRRREETNGS